MDGTNGCRGDQLSKVRRQEGRRPWLHGYVARARIEDAAGTFVCHDEAIRPTDEEKKAIEAEVDEAKKAGRLPRSVAASKANVEVLKKVIEGAVFVFLDRKGDSVLFVQERQELPGGKKNYLPWSNSGPKTPGGDGWSQTGPADLRPEADQAVAPRVSVHEGAKAAPDTQALVDEGGGQS